MIEEGDPIWTLMISYFMQKDTDDDETTSDNSGRIGNARDLAGLALLSALRSKRESIFKLDTTTTSLQLNTTELGCPGRGAQWQGGRVRGGHGGVEGCAQAASEGDEGLGPRARQGGRRTSMLLRTVI